MRDVISTAILDSQVQHATNGETRWAVTFVNNETWTGPIEKLGTVYVIYDDRTPVYFSADQVIYLTIALNEAGKQKVHRILAN